MAEYVPTTEQMQAWAADVVNRAEYVEFVSGMKREYFRQWLEKPTPLERERIYAKVHAIADLENLLRSFSDGKVIDFRKAQQKVKK